MLRKVIRTVRYRTPSHPRGTHSAILHLSCGHRKHVKGSDEPKSGRAQCKKCKAGVTPTQRVEYPKSSIEAKFDELSDESYKPKPLNQVTKATFFKKSE